MKLQAICPISSQQIDERIPRINGAITVSLLILYALTQHYFIILFLVADFFARAIEKPGYSLLAIISKGVLSKLATTGKKTNAGPKIFAARIGFVFSLSIAIFSLFGVDSVATILVVIFGVCAFLEAAFNFCVACKVYPFVYRFTHLNEI
jgi:hypothetical protein